MRKVFKCDHCGKNYLRTHACARHETYCPKNPTNKHACFGCKHLDVGSVTDGGYHEKTFTCTAKDLQLHSFKAERIGHSCLGYTERMPLQCDKFVDAFTYDYFRYVD